ncbi:MAG: hypothetical protein IT337_17645 [Thermomicrobiales bacterium]|nr:hypothetical protein [Thermomicrobiales bacterium]
MSAAVIVAPFLALLYDPNAGLGVLLVALLTTSWLGWEASGRGPAELARRLRRVVVLNIALAVVALIVLIARLR